MTDAMRNKNALDP